VGYLFKGDDIGMEFDIVNFREYRKLYKGEVLRNNIYATVEEIRLILERMYINYVNKKLNIDVETVEEAVHLRKLAYNKKHYLVNRDKKLEYIAGRKDIKAEYDKQYFEANKDRRRAYLKAWYQANKERLREKDRERYRRKKEEKLKNETKN
jgi:hypothetical protein